MVLTLVGGVRRREKSAGTMQERTRLPPITLKPKKKKKSRSRGAKGLDALSAVLLEPTTILKEGFAAGGVKVAERRERIRQGDKVEAFKVVGETITAATLAGAGVLGVAAPAAAGRVLLSVLPRTLKGQLITSTVIGGAVISPTIRGALGRVIENPFAGGIIIGDILEKSIAKEETTPFLDALKTGGLLAGGAAAIAAGVAGTRKIKSVLASRRSEKTAEAAAMATPFSTPSSVALPVANIPTPTELPVSTEPVIAKEKGETVPSIPSPDITVNVKNRVMNKPQINVAIANA